MRYFVDEENSVKNVGTVRNWPPSPAEAAPLCYISLIHEPAIMGNERGEGREGGSERGGGQGVGGQKNQQIVKILIKMSDDEIDREPSTIKRRLLTSKELGIIIFIAIKTAFSLSLAWFHLLWSGLV